MEMGAINTKISGIAHPRHDTAQGKTWSPDRQHSLNIGALLQREVQDTQLMSVTKGISRKIDSLEVWRMN